MKFDFGLLFIFLVASCSGASQERTAGVGKNSDTSKTAADGGDEEGDQADVPVQVSGAYLTADHAPPLADKQDSESSFGGRVEKNGEPADMTGLTVTGKIITTLTGVTLKEFSVDLAPAEFQFQFNLPTADVALFSITVEAADLEGKKKVMTRDLKDLAGALLATMSPDQVFDFKNLSENLTGLTAASYCDANGPLSSVMKQAAGLPVPLAVMTAGQAMTMNKTEYCFQKITDYMSPAATTLLAPKEKNGSYVGSGKINGGTLPCLFAVIDSMSGGGAGSTKFYVIKDTGGTFEADLRKTAFENRCN